VHHGIRPGERPVEILATTGVAASELDLSSFEPRGTFAVLADQTAHLEILGEQHVQ
jgi:hypothetical protein